MYWDKNGFCLWMKRLEEDRFHWPTAGGDSREINGKELQWLLDGLDVARLKPHQARNYSTIL